jgi:penicillin-binding protein 1A
MDLGQGASMALPIIALYMKKVYADSQLGYNENAIFDLDEGYDPCQHSDNALDDFNDIEDVYE